MRAYRSLKTLTPRAVAACRSGPRKERRPPRERDSGQQKCHREAMALWKLHYERGDAHELNRSGAVMCPACLRGIITAGHEEIRGLYVPSVERAQRLRTFLELNNPRLYRFVFTSTAPPRLSSGYYSAGFVMTSRSCSNFETAATCQYCPNNACDLVGKFNSCNKWWSSPHQGNQPG
jgi:hypothetical protein